MKRADSQKVNQSVVVPATVLSGEPSSFKQVYPESNRRVYTSAAMIGLAAMSMSLLNLLFSEGQQAARAVEPVALDPTNRTTDPAVSPPDSTIAQPSTVAYPEVNSSNASLGNRPVVEPTEWLSAQPYRSVSFGVTSQPPSPNSEVQQQPLNPKTVDQATEIVPPAQKQAALEEVVKYVAVLEAVNADPSRTLTVLPSGKNAPKLQSLALSEDSAKSLPPEIKVATVVTQNLKESDDSRSVKFETALPTTEVKGSQGSTQLLFSGPGVSSLTEVPEKVTLGRYQVQSGDTLQAIAKTHQVDESALIQANRLNNPDHLEVNQSLTVPQFAATATEAPKSAATVASPAWQSASTAKAETFDGSPKWLAPSSESLELPTPTALSQTKDLTKDGAIELGTVAAEPQLPELPKPSGVNTVASAFDPQYAPFPQPHLHQVRAGETLDAIARRYGVARADLIRINQITDPNLIQVNQNLKIPTAQKTQPSLPPLPGVQTTHISSALIDSQQSIPLLNLSASTSEEKPSTPVSLHSSSEPETGYNSYVEGLTSEINQLRQQYQDQPRNTLGTPPKPAAPPTVTLPRTQPVNPEFSPSGRRGDLQADLRRLQQKYQANGSQSTPQVAVAPLGPDAYDPSQLPIGEMVSPEIPPLAPGERYLPSDRMNGYIWPSQGVLTSGYGWRWGRMHKGIDIAGPIGTPIFAAASGVVDYAGWNSGGYGNLVDIRHPDGSLTRYAHNNRVLVREGQYVRQGQQIAEMGSTGYSTGPHLHFEIHVAGQGATNPMAYLPNR